MPKCRRSEGKRSPTVRSTIRPEQAGRIKDAKLHAEMIEGYRAMAKDSRENAEATLAAQAEVVLRDDLPSNV